MLDVLLIIALVELLSDEFAFTIHKILQPTNHLDAGKAIECLLSVRHCVHV